MLSVLIPNIKWFYDEEERDDEKDEAIFWQCRNCGYIYVGTEAPEVCPACLHPQAYFEVKKNNYWLK